MHVASAPVVEYKSDCCELCFSSSYSVCCGGAWQQIHQFRAKDDLRNQRQLTSTTLQHQRAVTQLQLQFLSWNTFFSSCSVCRGNTCGSVHISCSSDKLRRANPCRGIHLSALADYAAPVPEVEYISLAAVSYAAPAQLHYAAPVRHVAPTINETGIDLHWMASQMYSQRPQAGYAAPAQYGAPPIRRTSDLLTCTSEHDDSDENEHDLDGTPDDLQ